MTTITARATRTGGWWAIEVPEIDGLFTQARRLDQVPAMVRDAAEALTGEPGKSFTISLVPLVDPEVSSHMETAARLFEEAREAQHRAAEESREAARELTGAGLTVRDVGVVMGISYQRVHQLVSEPASR